MLGRTLLPAFGGSAGVWTACLATYQVLLLAGYWYAHMIAGDAGQTRVSGRQGTKCHLILLAVAVMWVFAFAYFRPLLKTQIGVSGYPALEVLFCVLACVGMPYILLSANSTLVQAWLSGAGEQDGRRSGVYSLYGVSNAGSLLGLLCYPLLVEPFCSLNVQWCGFAAGFGVYAVMLGLLARRTTGVFSDANAIQTGAQAEDRVPVGGESCPSRSRVLLWLGLPAASTFLLNAVTAHLSTDVSPIPLLWVVLLAAFLVSYIIGFSAIGEKGAAFWCFGAVLALFGCAYAMRLMGQRGYFPNLLAGVLLLLFGCAFLHSWLYRLRPDTGRLTTFYLCLAAGGAAGGLLSGIVAPSVFPDVYEYPFILLCLSGLVLYYLRSEMPVQLKGLGRFSLGLTVLAVYLTLTSVFSRNTHVLWKGRNFYGCMAVKINTFESPFSEPIVAHNMDHGQTLHGVQFRPHYLRDKPTTYYGPYGGGFAVLSHPGYATGTPMTVGVVGLGVGTMACWGRTNDVYRFFEINPAVVHIASDTNYFSFLSDSAADVSVVTGDARKMLSVDTNRYDVLVIDAYSGDSVPFHLATREAFQLYFDRLNTNGILAVHITNWHIDLQPLCKAVGKQWDIGCYGITSPPAQTYGGATWAFFTRLALPMKGRPFFETDWETVKTAKLPSDEKGSLIGLVRYGIVPHMKPMDIDLSTIYRAE